MGGSVSSGRDNYELIDNLVNGNYIRSRKVEKVFRALDRGDYVTPEARRQAYKDLAWREGLLHMSSPCIYSEVMEGLELKPGLSFLNIGSGTGYLSTLAGLILGTSGTSHGVEVHPCIVEYASMKLEQFIENSPSLDDFDFCEPKFFIGNALSLAPLQSGYDRVYCGAACPENYVNYLRHLIKVGGILVAPINDTLQQIKRVSEKQWVSISLLHVSFAPLRSPTNEVANEHIKLADIEPPRLAMLTRARIRASLRENVLGRRPELQDQRWWFPSCFNKGPRRVVLPMDSSPNHYNLNDLHDLDEENGANEMNALLSLVISMGEDRLAGALRFNRNRTVGPLEYLHDSQEDDDSDESTETVEPATETNDQSIEIEVDSSTRSNHELKENTKDSVVETETKDDYKSDSDESESEIQMGTSGDFETDSQSDSSSVADSRTKNRQLWTRRTRTLTKLKRLSKVISRGKEIGKASTSKGKNKKDAKKNDCMISSSESDDEEKLGDADNNAELDKGVETIFQGPSTSADVNFVEVNQLSSTNRAVAADSSDMGKSKAKRQKLDSGIGENSGSGDDKTNSEGSSDSWEDIDTSVSSAGVDDTDESDRRKSRVRRKSLEARRRELALMMKQAVAALPLPHPLKIFVNWGRCYQL